MSYENNDNHIKTNSREFDQVYEKIPANREKKLLGFFVQAWIRIKRHILRIESDDYNWDTYSEDFYGPEQYREQLCYTTSLDEVEYMFQDNKLYTISDGKPIHYVHRNVYESIYNLPKVSSVAEIGLGNGKHLVNLRYILGPDVKLSGFDISHKQIDLFRKTFASEGNDIQTGVLDITKETIEKIFLPDVVFACTVLMHIKRPDAYQCGLRNLLFSTSRFAVIVDWMASHDYFNDIMAVISGNKEFEKSILYYYDSGSYISIVISVNGEELFEPYQLLRDGSVLLKYDN